jgi:cytochrome c peroxidase
MLNAFLTPEKKTLRIFYLILIITSLSFLTTGCSDSDDDITGPAAVSLIDLYNLERLGPIPYPPDNPKRFERIELGRLLFYDPVISGELDVSCATCHHPAFAFGDARQLAAGVSGRGLGPGRILGNSAISGESIGDVPRNSPSVFNTAYYADETGQPTFDSFMFWDGRVKNLDVQATKPITSRIEMRGDVDWGEDGGAVAMDSVAARLRMIPDYVTLFEMAFPEEAAAWHGGTRPELIDSSTFGRAIGAFERELVTVNSAYDRFVAGDESALTDAAKRGLVLFHEKANCVECHGGPMFSDFQFVVHGTPQVGPGKDVIPGDDTGREEFTNDPADRYAFRTPSLRNVELTAPYMHDGYFATLEEVIQFHLDGCQPRHESVSDPMMDPVLIEPLELSAGEILDLVSFLKALTDPGTLLPAYLLEVPENVPSGLTPVIGVADPGSGFHAPENVAAK